ncbi:ABC transporter permease [Actinomadura sp. ATCC 31491]|uniref:ABC transporter permease n=1 Tax=Actinomadura luzonensis TaxID=2805427 RepID=A0ABT0G2I5_9ACTN|nr:ABC transporter permease [Actinomadura luzonensis]MCK2218809.1 ABC transporter permease [Actinomadura luzonensis]
MPDIGDDLREQPADADPAARPAATPEGAARGGNGPLRRIRDEFLRRREASVLVVALALGAYFASASEAFLTRDNMVNISQAAAPGAIVACGIVLLLVSGEIDLSVGVVAALAPFMMHYAIDYWGFPALAGILLALLTGTLVGLGNGFVTVVLKVPSFVTTLGSFYLVTGIVLTTSGAYPAEVPGPVDNAIGRWLGAADWAHLAWALVIVAFFHVLFTRTRWGLHTIAVGGNLLGAQEAGVRAGRIKIGNFMIAGTLGAFAGLLEAFRVHTIDPNLGGGTGLMFTAVSAAVIGGTALAGGSGTIVGGALGALVLAELQNGFNLIGISANPYFVILGGAILLAMIANVYLSRLRRAGKTR